MRRLLLLGSFAALALFHRTGYSLEDSCEDYLQRHYKADLVPVSAFIQTIPNQGDIAGGERLVVRVKNIGNLPLQGPSGGILAANPLTLSVRRTGRHVAFPLRPAAIYQTFINAPLAPGATADVSVAIPTGSIANCSKMQIHIDVRKTAKQHGCLCYNNDTETFNVQRKGSLNCLAFVLPNP